MKFKLSAITTIAAVSVAAIPSTNPDRAGLQLHSCKSYVAAAPEFIREVSMSEIEAKPVRLKLSGLATVNWWIKDGRASGYCLVDGDGKILGYENYARTDGTLWVLRISTPVQSPD